jgi:hypothetical protein
MIHITDIYALKAKINKMKYEIDKENCDPHSKWLAHHYMNKVLDSIDELRLH